MNNHEQVRVQEWRAGTVLLSVQQAVGGVVVVASSGLVRTYEESGGSWVHAHIVVVFQAVQRQQPRIF